MEKSAIIQALRQFTNQRPGLEFGNYGNVSAYRSELRDIGNTRKHALALLRFVELFGIDAAAIVEASRSAFSGRLTLAADGGRVSIDYCTGQYWPTEYRRAVCAVLSSAIWAYFRNCGYATGDAIRARARAEFGRTIAQKWFS